MKRWLKWTLGGVVGAVALSAIAVRIGVNMAGANMVRKIDLQPYPVAYSDDPQVLDRGRSLFESRGCADCHGTNGGGHVFVDDGSLKFAGPNITSAGVTSQYQADDWERTIRHGVKPSGHPVMEMPSENYNRLTDADLSALVSYVRHLPAQKGGPAIVKLPLRERVLYGYGRIKDAAAKIDHSLPPAQ